MKRGYLWVDWVELGCRGWAIDEIGAGLDWDSGTTCHEYCYAHLDRTTVNLVMHGCRPFQARVVNDLFAVGILKWGPVEQSITATWVFDGVPIAEDYNAGTGN